MRLPGARGAALVDWTSGLALGTVGEAPGGDQEAAAIGGGCFFFRFSYVCLEK